MKFNTAILYDIENLMGGYSKADYLSDLSLKDIFDDIMKKDIAGVAIQRAYANWSDSRLNVLRGDIINLGIEPVQMFGFGRGPQKNASDIQLAIDAIDIAFTRSSIECFVIVSGDGGFSSLAKKLHEYGKMVIGCGYRKSTNQVFKAVCDDFIWIEISNQDELANPCKTIIKGNEIHDPVLLEFSERFSQLISCDKESVFKRAKEIFRFLATAKTTKNIITSSGINIGIYSQLLAYRIENFNYINYGFTKLVDFIRYVINNTQCKLVFKEPSEYRILSIDLNLSGFVTVENIIQEPNIHSLENYKQLLYKFDPRFPLPPPDTTYQIIDILVDNKVDFINLNFGDLVDRVSTFTSIDLKDIKSVIKYLISAECFSVSEQKINNEDIELKYSFICTSSFDTIKILKAAANNKLINILGNVDSKTLDVILP